MNLKEHEFKEYEHELAYNYIYEHNLAYQRIWFNLSKATF